MDDESRRDHLGVQSVRQVYSSFLHHPYCQALIDCLLGNHEQRFDRRLTLCVLALQPAMSQASTTLSE